MMSRTFRLGSEGEEDQGKSEIALNNIGVAVRNTAGEFRNFDTIMDEVRGRWDSLTNVQKTNLAQQIGG